MRKYMFFLKHFIFIKDKVKKHNNILDKFYNSFIIINKKYIEELNEDSPAFFKMLEIYSNYGYFKGEKIFYF